MSIIDYKALQDSLSPEDIKSILEPFGTAAKETEQYIIFPTFCHNKEGGSHKLYYYKDSKSFHCYTECSCNYSIFNLLVKIYSTRGTTISFWDAISICGFGRTEEAENELSERKQTEDEINALYAINNYHYEPIKKIPTYSKQILNRFIWDEKALSIWAEEGISYPTMRKYHIAYDPIENCIIIPNYDLNNNLISIRGRFLDDNAYAKYRPIIYGGKVISHPSSSILYGLNINQQAIKYSGQAIIFESEKSVLKMDTIYGIKNISVATLGQNVSLEQIRLLRYLGVNNVVLAYDADYNNYSEMNIIKQKYINIANKLKKFFNVSIIMDWNFDLLHYKDSPIDCGKETFEELLKRRLIV